MEKIRNEEYSIFYYLGDQLVVYPTVKIVNGFPYNELQAEKLSLPSISIEHASTAEYAGELGAVSYLRRSWIVDVFAATDVQRDELVNIIWRALENSIPIKDYTTGFPPGTTNQSIIDYMQVEDRTWRPVNSFQEFSRLKYWRANLVFYSITQGS